MADSRIASARMAVRSRARGHQRRCDLLVQGGGDRFVGRPARGVAVSGFLAGDLLPTLRRRAGSPTSPPSAREAHVCPEGPRSGRWRRRALSRSPSPSNRKFQAECVRVRGSPQRLEIGRAEPSCDSITKDRRLAPISPPLVGRSRGQRTIRAGRPTTVRSARVRGADLLRPVVADHQASDLRSSLKWRRPVQVVVDCRLVAPSSTPTRPNTSNACVNCSGVCAAEQLARRTHRSLGQPGGTIKLT